MERAASSYCRRRLSDAGYAIVEEQFAYSSRGARFTPPAAGVFAALIAFLAAHLAISHRSHLLALAVLIVAVLVAAIEARRFLGGAAGANRGDEQATNLVAMRGTPRVWLVAHVDSKSQTIPMLLRVGAVVGLVVGVAGLVVMSLLGTLFDVTGETAMSRSLVAPIGIFTAVVIISAIPLALCWIGNHSPGALDNASGVAAVLLAAEGTARNGIGVVITSAEELGLAGARAFTAEHDRGIALNCDTIDDEGDFVALSSAKARGTESIDALRAASKRLGVAVRVRGMIPGVVTDGTALARAGWDVATLSRGNLATLRRVHTSRDTPERINGTGIALAARLLAASIEELG
jgi:peptidase M28-like protein